MFKEAQRVVEPTQARAEVPATKTHKSLFFRFSHLVRRRKERKYAHE